MSEFQDTKKDCPISKVSRLRVRFRNPEWRRYGKALLAGKGIGVALVLLVIGVTSIFMADIASPPIPN